MRIQNIFAVCLALVLLCVAITLIGGCAVSGTTGNQKLTQDNVSKITKGVTTRDQVVTLLGQPDYVTMMPDGRRSLIYSGTQSNGNYSGTMIQAVPIVGGLIPVTNTDTMRNTTLQIMLSADNVVEDYQYSDNTSETKATSSMFGGHSDTVTVPTGTTQPSTN